MNIPAIMPTYGRMNVKFVRGAGVWLWDDEGRRYLDALSGIAVCGLGHAHPRLAAALCAQASVLWHTSNLYRVEWQERLAETLIGRSALDAVFFANSGAEANEAAIKIARLAGHRAGVERPVIIVMDGSFHGRTLGALSATGNAKVQQGFGPLLEGFVRVPYGDAAAVARVVAENPAVVAVMVEPIQGEGGVVVPAADYLPELRALCDRHGLLLMLDEVQTGMGRTGHWFACQGMGVRPDVMTLAKGLGNGFPIGACLAAGAAAAVLQPGSHGSTFGGNPLAACVAQTVCEVIEEQQLTARAATLGVALRAGFKRELAHLPGFVEVRGRGLMLGIVLDRPCGVLVQRALEQGLLINVTAEQVLRLLPPLILSDEEAGLIVTGVSALVAAFLAETSVPAGA
ncbi:MAG: aspartate aminotransferase family protein [Gammaproteobacteria bacterium]|nr:aspartate aminotransferase family protein [Gammaproteobacteria bacterium]